MKKLVLSIAFIGFGSFAMAQQTQDRPRMNKEEMQQKMMQKEQERLTQMQKDLNLNASQVAQIKALHEKNRAEMQRNMQDKKADRQAKMAEMKEKNQRRNDEMKSILTPEQYSKWEGQKKAKMDERRAMMKDRGMKGKKMMPRDKQQMP
ncbi:hypothetical protein ASG01_07125 [Chryseobacterium sp. Leaf180]|uniref:hypothetical protein n=1 Tax=Chryseobacterium sp. Leaf180 TaxID=1736289 RepID=UPI0006F71774|nr:hypothetical protein [Chryseobacterium sp. Leaf180]KQR95606.1 hypothetical protein ASG01_07125 [Chryseobacterium sp. Leaf180]